VWCGFALRQNLGRDSWDEEIWRIFTAARNVSGRFQRLLLQKALSASALASAEDGGTAQGPEEVVTFRASIGESEEKVQRVVIKVAQELYAFSAIATISTLAK